MLLIRDFMKQNVYSIPSSASISEAARVFVKHHVGILPVVDELGKPIGILRLRELLSLELPDFFSLVEDVDFVHDFGAVETTRPEPGLLARPVTALMQPILAVESDSGLLRAYALMLKEDLQDIPVTDAQGVLVGIVSRVDVATAVLSNWQMPGGGTP
jgi:DHA2 family lincomycin resistance protein-like MFS transporter